MYLDLNADLHPNTRNHLLSYTHEVHIVGVGGEAVITRIPQDVATYWNGFSREELASLVIDQRYRLDETIEGAVINPSFSSEVWHESGDVVALNGPSLDWMPDVYVEKANGKVIAKMMLDEEVAGHLLTVDEYLLLDDSSSYFVGRTGELVHQVFRLNTSQPFDVNRLKLEFGWFIETRILKGVTYDGKPLHIHSHYSQDYDGSIAGIVSNR